MKIYIDKPKRVIKYGNVSDTYSYFSFLGNSLKYGSVGKQVNIILPENFEIFIDKKIRWKYPKK